MAQINKPTDYFNTKLYTGTGAIQSVSGVGFQPDWLWTKIRSNTGNHTVWDSVRGANASLQTSTTNAEGSSHIDSFDSDGFTLDAAIQNTNSETYASWNWLAGGTASSNTDGTITSTVSANTTSGFSVVSFTGTGASATVGHGLGATPVMGIFKNRTDAATNWRVWHQGIANNQILELNATTAAAVPGTADFNISNNTTSVWGLETNNQSNGSGDSMIAYIFAEKKGFSKFGSYTGNGSTDGTFVYTGFRPAFLITKRSDTAGNSWILTDNTRDTDNVVQKVLYPDGNGPEASSDRLDFLSNGFKQRTTSAAANASGSTYIYMAFAENPLVGTNNIPATAR